MASRRAAAQPGAAFAAAAAARVDVATVRGRTVRVWRDDLFSLDDRTPYVAGNKARKFQSLAADLSRGAVRAAAAAATTTTTLKTHFSP